MTNADRILAALARAPGSSDAELVTATGIRPHQQVNQICRRLADQGLIDRGRDTDGTIRNYVAGTANPSPRATPATPPLHPRPEPVGEQTLVQVDTDGPTLFVLPCSADKRPGGAAERSGPSVLDLLPAALADRLRTARRDVGPRADLDEARWRPARERYTGTLYRSAGGAIAAMSAKAPVIILSGGYGILLADEPIGIYDRQFDARDWPRGLLEDCLLAVVDATKAERVVGYCARTTSYAKVLRRTPWRTHGTHAATGKDPLDAVTHDGPARELGLVASSSQVTVNHSATLQMNSSSSGKLLLSVSS